MGRPYASELAELPATYQWCLSVSVDDLCKAVLQARGHNLISIGSGGSLTSAAIAAHLHTCFSGNLAHCLTPYGVVSSSLSLQTTAALLLTAGGSNPDVTACAQAIVERSPAMFATICMRTGSPISKLLRKYPWTTCHEFASPVRKDGFLATNSLLATAVLLIRAYENSYNAKTSLPGSLSELLHPGKTDEAFVSQLSAQLESLSCRPTLSVIHGFATQPAALDIESRFTEGALGNVHIADYRNFAHGRHHWLARHADNTGVLVLSTKEEVRLAQRTAALLPDDIPVAHLTFPPGIAGLLSSVIHSIYIAWIRARPLGIDPGRPFVPTFGRKLYHLKPFPNKNQARVADRNTAYAAIERKAGVGVATLDARQELEIWDRHYHAFLDKLRAARFRAIVFDYDGTLCDAAHRFGELPREVVNALNRLLRAGLTIGIATGRGKSVGEALRSAITAGNYRKRVLIGYHNGAEIGRLSDRSIPPPNATLHPALVGIASLLRETICIAQQVSIQAKGSQITLEWSSVGPTDEVFECVQALARRANHTGITVLRSTHSIDLLAPQVSKTLLIKQLEHELSLADVKTMVLCIGDRGRWPGNDADLLATSLGLSVDEVSRDPANCWNIASPGSRNVDACLEYLSTLRIRRGEAHFVRTRAERSKGTVR